MKKGYIKYQFLILALITSLSGLAQNENSNSIDSLKFEEYKSQFEYDKMKTIYVVKQEKPKNPKEFKHRHLIPTYNTGSSFLSMLIYLIIAVIVLFILFTLIVNLPKKDKSIEGQRELALDQIENIEDIDANSLYQKALAEGNFRLALRMQFIKTLQFLQEGKLINWKSKKTNRDYVRELEDATHKSEFRQLANHFELFWYGNKPIDQAAFISIDQQFLQFNQKIKALSKRI